jgi:hypothetical protein
LMAFCHSGCGTVVMAVRARECQASLSLQP